MSLMDFLTRDEIYNPFIKIYSPCGKGWVAINSTTFGEAQADLISVSGGGLPFENGLGENRRRIYSVHAVVCQQGRLGHKRVQHTGYTLSDVLLGVMEEERLKELFPKIYDYLIPR